MKNNILLNEVKKYLSFLQFEKKLSINTVNSYWFDLKMYISYLIDKYRIESFQSIGHKHIKDYIQNIYKFKNNTSYGNASINRTISSIKNFHKYLLLNEIVKKDASKLMKSIKLKQTLPNVLTVEEIDKIIDSIDLSQKNGLRNKALIMLMYSSGLRVSELVNLSLINFYIDDDIIRIFGKGQKERLVPIGGKAKTILLMYISNKRPQYSRKSDSKGIIFLSNRGKPLSRKTVWNIIRIVSLQSGINKKVTPHTFRHSFASHLLEGGANLRVVQELLGHTNISTTQIYTHLDKTYLKEIHKEFHPRG